MYTRIIIYYAAVRVGELLEVFSSLDKARREQERTESEQKDEEKSEEGAAGGEVSPPPAPDNDRTSTSTIRQR